MESQIKQQQGQQTRRKQIKAACFIIYIVPYLINRGANYLQDGWMGGVH
jgi:hypothetical protein